MDYTCIHSYNSYTNCFGLLAGFSHARGKSIHPGGYGCRKMLLLVRNKVLFQLYAAVFATKEKKTEDNKLRMLYYVATRESSTG